MTVLGSSNVGIFGSAQAFEALLLRLQDHPLAEARVSGERILKELRQVIPVFMRRVDREDRGQAWSRYLRDTADATHAEVSRLVADAKRASHPLHSRFTWDDTVAAQRYRLVEARELVRTVVIQRGDGTDRVRAWVHLNRETVRDDPDLQHLADGGGTYAPAEWVAERPDLKAALLLQMNRDWTAFRRKYEAYQEFWELLATSSRLVAS